MACHAMPHGCVVDICLKWDIMDNTLRHVMVTGPLDHVAHALTSANLDASLELIQRYHEKASSKGGEYHDSNRNAKMLLLPGNMVRLKMKFSCKMKHDPFPQMRNALFQSGWQPHAMTENQVRQFRYEKERWTAPKKM